MKDMNQRLFLTIALWLAVIFGYYMLQPKHAPVAQKAAPAASSPDAAAPAPAPAPAVAAPSRSPVQADRPRTQKITFETPRARVVATSDGAALESIALQGEKFARHRKSEPDSQVDLVESRAGEPLPYSTEVRSATGQVLLPVDAAYEVVQHDARSATFRATAGDVTLTKTFTLDPASYRLDLTTEVTGATGAQLAVIFGTHAVEPPSGFFASRSNVPARTICQDGKKVERVAIGAKHPDFTGAAAQFAGIDEQYFLTAVVAPAGTTASCRLLAQGEKAGSLTATLAVPVAPGKMVFTGYAGPKDPDALAAVARPLKESVDLGFWSVIADVLLGVMRFFQKVVPGHNWGVSIILLTLAMKALTFPLQHKSMKSMQEMQRLQPQLEELKKKYAGDQQRQNLEQMKLFKEHGVNPMGSCLPMVIQMPIWFALYTALQVSVDLYNAPFIHGWLEDLTSKDPYYVLPVAMGATMILTQVLTPTPMSNPSQKTMGYVMSGVFSFLMLSLPSGLTLYIFTNNVLSIIQQMYLRRAMKLTPPPASGATVQLPKGGGSGSARAKLRA